MCGKKKTCSCDAAALPQNPCLAQHKGTLEEEEAEEVDAKEMKEMEIRWWNFNVKRGRRRRRMRSM